MMLRATSAYAPLLCALALVTSACTKTHDDAATTAPSPEATVATASLNDVAGIDGEAQIERLAQLAVLDPLTGSFDPGRAVERRTFVRRLVKANDVLWSDAPDKLLKLADRTEKSAFRDVPASDPDFAYIQGMQDAGYSVGYPDGTFRPDAPLTREQMFAIEDVFDRGSVDAGLQKNIDFARDTAMPPWKDKASISKTYVAAIATGAGGGAENFNRVYGASSLFRPRDAVTRAQAAVLVSVIGDHTFYGSGRRSSIDSPTPPAPSST